MAIPASFTRSGEPSPPDPQLTIVLTRIGDGAVCSFAWELDMSNETQARQALADALAE
ncbi:hypothetical protein AB0442_41330 [Kitasatospora sp. NPDC085895]|uniref:hypothetical protein n=1 Tax=Kitasatospora sp. NPDC085895 TaxID=3155057 RepID=UPI00344D199A